MKFLEAFFVMMFGCCCLITAQQHVSAESKMPAVSRCLSRAPSDSRCRAAKRAFYFDQVSRACREVLYGGCPDDKAVEPRDEINLFMDEQECKTVCSDMLCPESLCLMECPQGFQVDDRGCRACKCKTSPILGACPLLACTNICQSGYELDGAGCPTCTCKKNDPQPVAACQQMACSTTCAKGYEMDANGCQTCRCLQDPVVLDRTATPAEPCPAIECDQRCSRGYKLNIHGCQTCHCIEPSPLCSPNRPACLLFCEHGFMLDQDGCDRCECAGKPAQIPAACPFIACVEKCPRGYKLDPQGCKTCECIKQSSTCSKKAMCAMYCEHGHRLNQDGCPSCACVSELENDQENDQCSPMMCNMHCPAGFLKDKSGCPLCECEVDPCTSGSCAEDEVCISSPVPISSNRSQVYAIRCKKLSNGNTVGNFNLMMTVIAVIITCSLTALITTIFVISCTKRSQRHNANAIYKPLDSQGVHI